MTKFSGWRKKFHSNRLGSHRPAICLNIQQEGFIFGHTLWNKLDFKVFLDVLLRVNTLKNAVCTHVFICFSSNILYRVQSRRKRCDHDECFLFASRLSIVTQAGIRAIRTICLTFLPWQVQTHWIVLGKKAQMHVATYANDTHNLTNTVYCTTIVQYDICSRLNLFFVSIKLASCQRFITSEHLLTLFWRSMLLKTINHIPFLFWISVIFVWSAHQWYLPCAK